MITGFLNIKFRFCLAVLYGNFKMKRKGISEKIVKTICISALQLYTVYRFNKPSWLGWTRTLNITMKLLLHPSHIGWALRNRMPKEFRQCPVAFSQRLELDVGCFCFAVICCSLLNYANSLCFQAGKKYYIKRIPNSVYWYFPCITIKLERAKNLFVCCY